MAAKCIMVLGTSSGAGKSWIATALCRIYAQRGYKVAPFKAQNMSNNARVVDVKGHQGEIGSAQYFQALAAKAVPIVQMNPVLLKPEADTKSQLVLMGKVDPELSQTPWRERSEKVWPYIKASLDYLISNNDIVIIEGAGSPAEINLMSSDIVNMRVAAYANAKCLIVSDIDRGGSFAHLYGTWALLGKSNQAYIKGFILNKFRGDAGLLSPGPEILKKLTGVSIIATVPILKGHGLPEEDGVFDALPVRSADPAITIAIIAYPRISNLDEFQALKNISRVNLVWVRNRADLINADWIILPGSKHTSSDLNWLREKRLDISIQDHAKAGKAILAICGGMQMLGATLEDPFGIDGSAEGLNLLALRTIFDKEKLIKKTNIQFGNITNTWQALSNLKVAGYEIHHGKTEILDANTPALSAKEVVPNVAWLNQEGNILGIYLHGLFEDANITRALFGADSIALDAVFERLALHLEGNIHDAQEYLNYLIQ